jgi:hypothetical protein
MKKKMLIIGVMIFVCTGLFILAQKVQNSYLNNKVSTSQAQSKVAEKTGTLSQQEKTNTVTDIEKQASEVDKPIVKVEEAPKVVEKPVTVPAITASPKVVAKPEDVGPFNFRILDTVNNKVILEKNIGGIEDFSNKTLDYITCKLLRQVGIKYINEGEGTAVSYFNSIAGLTERKAGPLSGWCFYVNGVKPGIGAGNCIYHKGDTVEWKYSTDALNK